MLDALQFVKGAVARKDFIPALQHFRIRDGRIMAFNGTLALSSPIGITLDFAPNAEQLVKAIEACTDTVDVSTHEKREVIDTKPVALSLTETGRLLVRSGGFKTFVDCAEPSTYPAIQPEGKRVAVNNSLRPALRYLEPFIAEDASRPWACGIMLNHESAFATNNIVLLEYWLGFRFPSRVNIPAAAVRELLRIDDDPIEIQFTENRITFHYNTGRWLATQLYTDAWPDTEPLLNRESNQQPFPKNFFETLERIEPFLDEFGRVYFSSDHIATSPDHENAGTTLTLANLPGAGCFNGRQLLRLQGAVETIDFSSYPEPSLFYGPQARGLIVGIRT